MLEHEFGVAEMLQDERDFEEIKYLAAQNCFDPDIIDQDFRPTAQANFVSSHRSVISEYGGLSPRCMNGCTCKSRSHELYKSKLRRDRRRNRAH